MDQYSDQFFIDIVITALEGGIGYWSLCYAYDCNAGTASIRITRDDGTPMGNLLSITPDMLRAKWETIFKSPIVQIMDLEDLDAADCDVIVQLYLFGEVIFG